MPAVTATELLGAWEQCLSQSAVQRPLTLLSHCGADPTAERLAQLSLGQRDAALLTLRERAFGPRMSGLATCPSCALEVQLELEVSDIRVAGPSVSSASSELCLGECDVSFRLPNTTDLAALAAAGDVSSSKRILLERCLLSVRQDGRDMSAGQLSEEAIAAISDRMSEIDPQADVQLALSCPQCDQHWHAPFDISSFLWSEVHVWALRLLRDVHALAAAYGWGEAEILSLTPTRRQAYLELIER